MYDLNELRKTADAIKMSEWEITDSEKHFLQVWCDNSPSILTVLSRIPEKCCLTCNKYENCPTSGEEDNNDLSDCVRAWQPIGGAE